ncbi:hypothetical protein A11Q_1386 [Pseudobdellovibrio exovorus JSS]|uniref:Glycosyltransferase n=1 Tax=Pseudobdellovibrio exovorus JSS TaxID=1184267 RepID=M4V889_9BACT|nr:hypothetical protein A11Q_1386 [Pseudobdellovibrio exovorus JSS]
MAIVTKDGLQQIVFVIFAQSESSYQLARRDLVAMGIAQAQIVWCNPLSQSRYDFIKSHQEQWLCFLDHDCRMTSKSLQVLTSLVEVQKSSQQSEVYAGYYANPMCASYLQKAHNLVANIWVEHSFRPESKFNFFLGGAFLVRSWTELPALEHQKDNFWGAEDKYLSYLLQGNGFELKTLVDFEVVHSTTTSWQHFVRRAFLHGYNEDKMIQYPQEAVSYGFWLRRVGVSGLYLSPAIVLHFCIQRVARLAQKVPRMSKRYK